MKPLDKMTLAEVRSEIVLHRANVRSWHPQRQTVHLVQEQVDMLVTLSELVLACVQDEEQWVELKTNILQAQCPMDRRRALKKALRKIMF